MSHDPYITELLNSRTMENYLKRSSDELRKALTSTSQYLVSADGYFSSEIKDYDSFIPCAGWEGVFIKQVRGHASADLASDGKIQAKAVTIAIPLGTYDNTALFGKMNMGTLVAKITVHRMGNILDGKKPIQSTEFVNCHIVYYGNRPDLELIYFGFTFQIFTETHYKFDKTGLGKGQTATSFDFASWLST